MFYPQSSKVLQQPPGRSSWGQKTQVLSAGLAQCNTAPARQGVELSDLHVLAVLCVYVPVVP